MFDRIFAALVVVSLAFVPEAEAIVYGGNPAITVGVDWSGATLDTADVYLTKIRMHECDQTHADYTVGQYVDPVATYTRNNIAAGDYCGVTFYWNTNLLIDGSSTQDGDFIAQYSPNTTYVPISQDPIPPVGLSYSVISGTINVGSPTLWVDIH